MKNLILIAAVLLTGCLGVPLQKETASVLKGAVEARAQTNVEKITEGEKTPVNTVQPSVSVSGSSNRVEVKIESPEPPEPIAALPLPSGYRQTVRVGHTASDNASTSESSTSSVRLPISVALLITAVALTILLLLWRSAKKSSAALSAFADVVDNYFASEIRKHRSLAATSIDPAEIARHLAAVGELEANRGRITL